MQMLWKAFMNYLRTCFDLKVKSVSIMKPSLENRGDELILDLSPNCTNSLKRSAGLNSIQLTHRPRPDSMILLS